MTGEAPRPPSIVAGILDTLGRMWIRSVRAPSDWKRGLRSANTNGLTLKDGAVRAPTLQRLQQFAAEWEAVGAQSVIEVIDFKQGRVVNSPGPGPRLSKVTHSAERS